VVEVAGQDLQMRQVWPGVSGMEAGPNVKKMRKL